MAHNKHILVYEPRTEGHHLVWLKLIVESLLEEKFEITLALDARDSKAEKYLGKQLVDQVTLLNAYTQNGKIKTGSKLGAIEKCFQDSKADEAFCCCIDEFSSSLLRKTAFGLKPPPSLRGKVSGIFIRPRALDPTQKGLNNWIKQRGMKALLKHKWFNHIFLLDEFLANDTGFSLLPDPSLGNFSTNNLEAKRELNLPADKLILLHFGTASKRKGLELLLEALKQPLIQKHFFLLVAGNYNHAPQTSKTLKELEKSGTAKFINRFVSEKEQELCFCASDIVMIPYLNHYGSSSILSQAAAAQKPVIASNYHLLGKRVLQHKLGFTFENGNINSLSAVLKSIGEYPQTLKTFSPYLTKFAQKNTPKAFTESLLHTLR